MPIHFFFFFWVPGLFIVNYITEPPVIGCQPPGLWLTSFLRNDVSSWHTPLKHTCLQNSFIHAGEALSCFGSKLKMGTLYFISTKYLAHHPLEVLKFSQASHFKPCIIKSIIINCVICVFFFFSLQHKEKSGLEHSLIIGSF